MAKDPTNAIPVPQLSPFLIKSNNMKKLSFAYSLKSTPIPSERRYKLIEKTEIVIKRMLQK